jgi:hypothetical protein
MLLSLLLLSRFELTERERKILSNHIRVICVWANTYVYLFDVSKANPVAYKWNMHFRSCMPGAKCISHLHTGLSNRDKAKRIEGTRACPDTHSWCQGGHMLFRVRQKNGWARRTMQFAWWQGSYAVCMPGMQVWLETFAACYSSTPRCFLHLYAGMHGQLGSA